ncbi:MAG TPA: hypothetical protein VMT34_04585, partial [Aggregatilineales bacterium]|nr:hypothetical protein [Aggregatilineales bacterium]
QGVLQAQVEIFGGYQNSQDRIAALARYPLGSAQYFEDKQNWYAWIGDQISRYENSHLGGIDWNIWPAYLLGIAGLIALFRRHTSKDILFAGISMFAALALLLATPLPWQRYYLLLAASWAVVLGIGADTLRRLADTVLAGRSSGARK